MLMIRALTFASLAPLLATLVLLASPAEANHKAGHGSPPLGNQTTTLSDLDCADGEVAKWNGTTWACAADEDSDTDTDTLGELSCSSGEVAKFDGSAWACAADADSDTDTDTLGDLSFSNGQVAKFNGSTWACAADEDTDTDTDTDTLADLDCPEGDLARLVSGDWECAEIADFLPEIRAALGLSQLVFVTSLSFSPNLLGVAELDFGFTGDDGFLAADHICTTLAQDAGLPGDYVAWLSGSAIDARDRLTPGSGPFLRVDGVEVAADIADLTDGSIAAPIAVTETGGPPPVNRSDGITAVWTATIGSGVAGFGDTGCSDWTVSDGSEATGVGYVGPTSSNWTRIASTTCRVAAASALYCFQK